MNRRVLGAVVAVVLATAGTFVLVNYVRTAEERALAGEETVEVLVVRERIDQGTPASQLGDRVGTERVPRKVLAAGSLADVDSLDGRVAAIDLLPGEQLVSSRFVEPAVLEAEREIEIPEGLQLVTFPVNQTRSVGGHLRPGDTVGFIGSFSGIDTEVAAADEDADDIAAQIEEIIGDTTGFVLHKALVYRVQTDARGDSGSDPPSLGMGGDGDDADVQEDQPAVRDPRQVEDTPPGTFLVTLAVEAGDAEKIVFTAEYGTIWLTLEPDHADEEGTRVRTRESIYE